MKINVLVTAVGGPTALGILKCLTKKENIRLIGVDIQKNTVGSQFCDKVFCVPKVFESYEYKNAIKSIVEKENINVIFPTLQDEITIFEDIQEEIKVMVAIPKSNNFDILVDKEKLYKHLIKERLDQYVPRFFAFNDNKELKHLIQKHFADKDFVCIKNTQGHGGIGVAMLTDKVHYLQAIKQGRNNVYFRDDFFDIECYERRLVTEYLKGSEYSADILLYKGSVIAVVPRKRTRVSNGVVIDGIVEHNEKIIEAASKIAETVATDGFINMQFIDDGQGYKIIDLNARFCGSQIMSYGAGVNFPYLFIQYNILNERVSITPKWGTRMVRYWECCFYND